MRYFICDMKYRIPSGLRRQKASCAVVNRDDHRFAGDLFNPDLRSCFDLRIDFCAGEFLDALGADPATDLSDAPGFNCDHDFGLATDQLMSAYGTRSLLPV